MSISLRSLFSTTSRTLSTTCNPIIPITRISLRPASLLPQFTSELQLYRSFSATHYSMSDKFPVRQVTVLHSKAEFDELINEVKLPILVDAFAEWCGPCKMISPIVEKWATATDDVVFCKFDVDEVPDLASELGISAMPTFLFFKNGEKVDKVVGANVQGIEKALLAVKSL